MDILKEKLLNETYKKFMDIGLKGSLPTDILDEIIAPDITGIGTAIDEKIFSLSDFRDLLKRQKKQSEGLQMQWSISPAKHTISPGGNTAVFVDDINASITVNNETIEMYFRFSVVLEYQENRWMVVHFHGSKPENVESEKDTFGIEEWKNRNAELEKMIKEKTAELQKSLEELKANQAQLIQSEKLASLGQLAAGIAHEIKNPMNFVNNFAELSLEYMSEIQDEIGNLEQNKTTADIGNLLKDVEDNLKKIHQHGTRADGIVKSMLLHSRGGSGKLEPTNLNELIKEYVNLAFHGMRAGKAAINVKIDLELDNTLQEVQIIPEDFSRVILNLCKNAFDAMHSKGLQPQNKDYKPMLKVHTKMGPDGLVQIDIEDNGPGVSDTIKDKLFQPFFTTKKGTEGTGLGLSITHDIIKTHRGNINIESVENVFTRFEIQLPLNAKKLRS
jgi:signal transduction histidine kinase